MKLNINIQEHAELIAKYIAGEMNEYERKDFEQMVNKNHDNELLINQVQTDWELMGGKNVKRPNVDMAWDSMINRLESEDLLYTQNTVPVYRMRWAQVAAAILTVFVVSSVFLLSGIWSKDIIIQSSSDPSTLVHTLADGSTIYLKPNTQVTFNKRFGSKDRKVTLNGEAFFDVASNPDLPFEIVTQNATVKVLGTSFTVKSAKEEDFEVIVETGTVSISSNIGNEQSVVATAGERVTLANKQLTKSAVTSKSYPAWRTQRLQFKDETLSNVIMVINKNYKANILIDSELLASRRITVTFYNNTLNSIVEVMCAALNLEAQYEGNTIVLKESK